MKINSNNKVIVDFQHDQCQGKEITVTYDNLNNSYYLENETNRIKISRIDRTFSSIQAVDNPKLFNPNGKDKYKNDAIYDKCDGPQLIIYNDPSDGFFYNNIKQISVKDIYYDDKGHEITFNDKNPAWIFVTSLNSNGWGNIEKVRAQGPDNSSADIEKIAGSTVTGSVDENTTKEFTRTVELRDEHSNGAYLINYLRENADDLNNKGWNWKENYPFELTQTVTLHVKKTKDGYVYDNENAFFKGWKLPPISENGTEKYPDIEIPEVRVSTETAVRIRATYSANNSHTPETLKETEVGKDEEVPDTHKGWWYSDSSNNFINGPDWDNRAEDNRFGFVGAVAIKYQPGMTITYGADDYQWGSHWACTQTQVVSSLQKRVIIYGHIKDGIIPVTPDNPGNPGHPIDSDPNDQDPKRPVWPAGTDKASLSKDVTESINYEGLPTKKAPVIQTLHFTGSGYLDKVTGKWTDKDGNELENQDDGLTWVREGTDKDEGSFEEVPSPTDEKGYHVIGIKVGNDNHIFKKDSTIYSKYMDGTTVRSVKDIITHNSEDTVITVVYEKNPTQLEHDQSIDASQRVEYVDENGKELQQASTDSDNFIYSGDTVDQVTHEIIKQGSWNKTQREFDAVEIPVIKGYVAISGYQETDGKYVAGGFTATNTQGKDDRNQIFKVVYKKVGKIVPVDPNHTPIPDAKTPNYQNDPDDPTKVTKDEPTPAVPGMHTDTPNVTPKYPTTDTEVVYEKDVKDVTTVVYYIDEDDGNKVIFSSENLTGKEGTQIGYESANDLKALTDKGYVLDVNSYDPDGKAPNFDSKVPVYEIKLKHGKVTVTPKNPGKPGEPINPNGPKWPAGTDANSLTKTGTQTIHYVGAGDKTPADKTQTYTFIKSMVIDKVTGKVLDSGSWNVESHTFGNVDTPVIPGYHADKDVAGGETVTPDDLNKVITVTYAPDGNPGNPSDHGDTPSPEPTPEPEPTPNPTPDDQPDSETSSDEHFEKVKAKDKLDKTNPKKVAAYKKERKIIKTKIAKQGHTEIAEPIEDKVTRENNVKVVSDPVENKAAEPKLPQTGEADNSIIGLLGMLLASFAAMFGFDSLHSHDKKHKN